jgi:hypothetical protein
MTSLRSVAASFILLGLAGCAVLPGSADDTLCLNCASPDASGDASFPYDGGMGGDTGLVPSTARSALCLGTCNPKNSKTTPDNPLACALQDGGTAVSDGGSNGGGTDLACRVLQTGNDPAVVECTTAGSHGDGASCNTGADCAPGYECVGTPGACHHYCCDDTACTTLGVYMNEPGRYFCDVQPETASPSTNVPVCMLAQPCDLLQNMCGDGMTCTLVDPSKSDTTSCVSVGTAKEGESCEVDHCGADMVCLGSIGSRTCHQLCSPGDTTHACAYGQQCFTQWPSLQKLNVGICQ